MTAPPRAVKSPICVRIDANEPLIDAPEAKRLMMPITLQLNPKTVPSAVGECVTSFYCITASASELRNYRANSLR